MDSAAVWPADRFEEYPRLARSKTAPGTSWFVFPCMDGRIRGVEDLVNASTPLTGRYSGRISKAGGPIRVLDPEAAPSIVKDIGLLYNRGVKTMVGIVHTDCHYMRRLFGSLTEEEEKHKFQEMGLHVAPILHNGFPDLNVLLWYLRLDTKTGVPLSFEPLFRGMNISA